MYIILKNLIKILQQKGHEFIIVARDKEVTIKLLEKLNIKYYNRGKGYKNIFLKILNMIRMDCFIYKIAKEHKPDMFLSFSSEYASHVAKIFKKPNIVLNDTEHVKYLKYLCYPFADCIITPKTFMDELGEKHIKIDSYMELCYLHPNYFQPDSSALKELGINENEKYVVLRFISWSANHDIGHKGLSYDYKVKMVKTLEKICRVFITSEEELPKELKKYRINISPEKLHDILAFAELYIGEGSTTASECTVLGTPNIYINSLEVGYITEQENKYGITFHYKTQHNVLEKALELLSDGNVSGRMCRNKILQDKIDFTEFLIRFIEEYPHSKEKYLISPK